MLPWKKGSHSVEMLFLREGGGDFDTHFLCISLGTKGKRGTVHEQIRTRS